MFTPLTQAQIEEYRDKEVVQESKSCNFRTSLKGLKDVPSKKEMQKANGILQNGSHVNGV